VKQTDGAAEKVNILLVDDRPENLLTLRVILSPLEQNLVDAHSGKEALKCLLNDQFAVILLDVMMPEMDGFETARLIRSRPKSAITPIIFVTAMFTEETHALSGYDAGAVDYIMKPFVPEILRSKVKNFIDLHRKTREIERQAETIRQIEQREYEHRLAEARMRMEHETQRVRAEQKVTQSVMELSPMGILRLTTSMAVADANPSFCIQFNINPEKVGGRHVLNLLPWLPESLVAAVQKGQTFRVSDFEIPKKYKPLERRWWDFTTWPVKDDNDQLTGAFLVVTDATQRNLLEEQRKEFIGTLAHDLQTPVIASDRALELLIERFNNRIEPSDLRLTEMLRDNNQNLLRMIQSLLEVYHYEAGARSLYFDKVNLAQLATICVDEMTPLAKKQGRKIKTQLHGQDHAVWADRTALRRLITNLIDNAVKYSNEGGQIDLTVSNAAGGNYVTLEVVDYGIGISKDDQKRLFERFWHRSGHKTYKGSSGLGLYLCRQIVEAHGGTITCQSKLGKMTKFTVSLPREALKAVAARQSEKENLPVRSS
jgi:signal transduction histidine kinase/DNA-binding response OmpR family regulator